MKKRLSKMYILTFALLSVMIMTGCAEALRRDVNKKPDDDISEAIYNAVGKKKVYYQGKDSDNPDEIVIYGYLVHDYEDEKVLENMAEATNEVMEEKKITGKIRIVIWEKIPGGKEGVASLRNYYETEEGYEQYDSFRNLNIYGTEHSFMRQQGSPYDKPSTYINLPDIKSLVVSPKIAKAAEEEGIDWYEIWPDLEYYEVLED